MNGENSRDLEKVIVLIRTDDIHDRGIVKRGGGPRRGGSGGSQDELLSSSGCEGVVGEGGLES